MALQPTHRYDDIIYLPHPVSTRHARMSLVDRGAQFSPFAALTGFEGVIAETGRTTQGRAELTQGRKEELNAKLQKLSQLAPDRPYIRAVYFQPDEWKEGGAYVCVEGNVRRVDAYHEVIFLTDGRDIPIWELYQLEGDCLSEK